MAEKTTIGWREWVVLPDLGIAKVKAKVDTGARTSSLHAFDVELIYRGSRKKVRFKVHPIQRDSDQTVECEATLLEERYVRSSNGKRELRPVILTEVEMFDQTWDIEMTLTSRDTMGFRMLLGREAIRGRCTVDPGRSYVVSRHLKPRRKKKKMKTKGSARK